MILFVYGTLRRGGSNHHLMIEGRAELLGEASTPPAFELLDLGPYPAMVAGGATSVLGEVYVVAEPLREKLDILEDVPQLYYRTAITLENGLLAETYLLANAALSKAPRIASGDWMSFIRVRAESP